MAMYPKPPTPKTKSTGMASAAPKGYASAMAKMKIPKAKGASADIDRKTKQAQSMNRQKLKDQKSAGVQSKRKTAEAKSYPPAKKAASSYALGLLPSQKKKAQKKGM